MKYGSKFPLLLFIIISFFSSTAFSIENLVSEQRVQQRIKVIDDSKVMDEKAKTNLLSIYAKVLDRLDLINTYNKQSKVYEATRKQAPEDIKTLKVELAEYEKEKLTPQTEKSLKQVLADIKNRPLAELEQALNSESANHTAVMAKNDDLKQTLNQELNSADVIRKRIVEANRLLDQRQDDKSIPLVDDNIDINQAAQWLLDAEIESLRSEIKMLDLKLLNQPSRTDILKLKAELLAHKIKKMEVSIAQFKQQVDLKRSTEIQKTQEITRTELNEAQGKHPLIASLAQGNAMLSDAITQRSQDLIKLEIRDDIVFKEIQRTKDKKENIKKKLEIAGLNQILGKVLWEQKKALPDSNQYQKDLEKQASKMTQLALENIYYQEELSNIKDKDDYLTNLLVDVSAETASLIQDDLIQLIDTRKILLQKIITISEKNLSAMSELDFSKKELIEEATNYAKLIDENLFWLRSTTVLSLNSFRDAPRQIKFLFSPSQWLKFTSDFFTMTRSSYSVIFGFLLIVLLLLKKTKIRKLLVQAGQQTKKISADSLLHTWKAIFYTLLLALPVPMLLWIIGRGLTSMPEVSPFSQAVADGMLMIVFPLFSLILFRKMCLPEGLFEVHFKWSDDLTHGLRKEMGQLIFTLVPILFIVGLILATNDANLNGGIGRLFILFILVTFALFLYRLFRAEKGVLISAEKDEAQSFLSRHPNLFMFFGFVCILFLMSMAIIGYIYMAWRVTGLLIYSVWFIFVLVTLQQMSVRWLLLTRRRYALKTAYEKHQEAQALKEQKQHNDELHTVDEDDIIELEEPEIDIISLSKDTQKLLHLVLFILAVFGFSYIWSDVLPALGVFEKITLWHHEGVVEGTIKLLPVTLADLIVAILILAMTLVGAKRLPAIIEILLIQNNTISSGGRYTATTLTNYIVLGVGFFAVFKILGADWNRFQWLFAALSVGIGFGLQEIVANFISGLIILFERPIRVGDLISVGENEGMVTRIQIRATTIMTYDRKELLVPNKEFITGQLVNLSLSDSSARIVIPVGVAYGSDIPVARQLMSEAALENERVLDEPTPTVMFRSFGDNSLNLELRCFVANVDNRVSTISIINEAINDKFNAAGISISFPQRDVHLDISQPIDIRLQGKPE